MNNEESNRVVWGRKRGQLKKWKPNGQRGKNKQRKWENKLKAKHKETEDSSEGERVPECVCGGLSHNLRQINFRNPGGLE